MSESAPINEPERFPGPGDAFGDGYEILRTLGEGGMGRVVLAGEKSLGRVVALKILKDRATDSVRSRFLREGRLLGALRAPGVVPVLHSGEDRATGLLFLALEAEILAPGDRARVWREWTGRDFSCGGRGAQAPDPVPLSLADLLDDGHTLPESSVLRLGGELVEALSALHGHEPPIVHRDLKPSNLLFGPDGHVRVTDFGIARSIGPDTTDFTLPGTAPGTWLWAAPEQKAGKEASLATDIHAVGLILYRALTGGLPLPGGSLPADFVPRVARAWRPFFRSILVADPTARPSLDDVKAGLERIGRALRRRCLMHRVFKAACIVLAVASVFGAFSALTVRWCRNRTHEDDRERLVQSAFAHAADLTNGLVSAVDGEELTLREGQTFSVADMEESGVRPSKIILDGGRILFSRPTKDLQTAIDDAFLRMKERSSRFDGCLEEILAHDPYPLRDETFSIPIDLTEKGGVIKADDLSVGQALIRGPVTAPSGGAKLSVRAGSMSVIVLDKAALGPDVSIAEHSRGKIIDFSTGRIIRWLDD